MVIRSKQKLKIYKPFNIVLVEPEIPPNTGNIARLCAATNTKLHLIHPLGFEINDKQLKRAGLDYWHLLDIEEYKNWNEFKFKHGIDQIGDVEAPQWGASTDGHNKPNHWFLSTRGEKNIWDIEFNSGDYLIFGSETKGLNEEILNLNKDTIISIPMNGKTRSLNLSTAVGIVLYEGLRQLTVEKKLIEVIPIR
jgi:tRNA (cytidine/uridine-2'-O-)-methyltransferase